MKDQIKSNFKFIKIDIIIVNIFLLFSFLYGYILGSVLPSSQIEMLFTHISELSKNNDYSSYIHANLENDSLGINELIALQNKSIRLKNTVNSYVVAGEIKDPLDMSLFNENINDININNFLTASVFSNSNYLMESIPLELYFNNSNDRTVYPSYDLSLYLPSHLADEILLQSNEYNTYDDLIRENFDDHYFISLTLRVSNNTQNNTYQCTINNIYYSPKSDVDSDFFDYKQKDKGYGKTLNQILGNVLITPNRLVHTTFGGFFSYDFNNSPFTGPLAVDNIFGKNYVSAGSRINYYLPKEEGLEKLAISSKINELYSYSYSTSTILLLIAISILLSINLFFIINYLFVFVKKQKNTLIPKYTWPYLLTLSLSFLLIHFVGIIINLFPQNMYKNIVYNELGSLVSIIIQLYTIILFFILIKKGKNDVKE